MNITLLKSRISKMKALLEAFIDYLEDLSNIIKNTKQLTIFCITTVPSFHGEILSEMI